MLAQKNEAISECVYTMAQLSEDEKIRMQCEARKDYLAIEKGLYNRGLRQGIQQGLEQGVQSIARNLLKSGALSVSEIAANTGLTVDEVEALKKDI